MSHQRHRKRRRDPKSETVRDTPDHKPRRSIEESFKSPTVRIEADGSLMHTWRSFDFMACAAGECRASALIEGGPQFYLPSPARSEGAVDFGGITKVAIGVITRA